MAKARQEAEDGGQRSEDGARPFWSGVITFGLVSVPVELVAAYHASRPSLMMLSPDGEPLRRRYVCSADGQVLEREDIVRGHEVDGDEWITVEEEELAELAPDASREIDLQVFVPRTEVDPFFCDRAYFLLPDGDATKPYRLLAATMEKSDRAGLATFVMRKRAYAIAITAERGVVRAEMLRAPDEVRSAEDVGLAEPDEPDEALLATLREGIAALAADALDPEELANREAAALRELAADKAEADQDVLEIETAEAGEATQDGDEPEGTVVDIMELLRQRLGARGKASA